MIYNISQIADIVKKNPNKSLIEKGRVMADKLLMHVHGKNMTIEQVEHFASKEVYDVQKKYAISNKDLFGRLLQQEDMVFTSRGGSAYFNLPEEQERQMNALLDDVRYGLSLRKWIKNFALQAYRVDPMGILFIEVEESLSVDIAGQMNTPRAYPTYKSIYCIFDYEPNGRRLEYVCFQLTIADAIAFGVKDVKLRDRNPADKSDYYRFVDDEKDVIVVRNGDAVTFADNMVKNPVLNTWGKVPAFIVSDLMLFNDPECFVSPLDLVVELADCFLFDRSVRDLQKKYHGFAKAVEPLLNCGTCAGTGLVEGSACPDCTPRGVDKGTGYKIKTKVADVVKFPLEIFEQVPAFDIKKIFTYITPDIESWNKQDMNLEDLEEMMFFTYWGSHRAVNRNKNQKSQGAAAQPAETATSKFIDTQPVYAKLSIVAEWAEKTEMMLADLIGMYWFDGYKKSQIGYGRYYVLDTPDDLMVKYQDMRTKGAPDFSLDEALEKYYYAMYQSNPVLLAKYVKLLKVEPFPHISVLQARAVITDFNDYNAKLYFGEWYSTQADAYILAPANTPEKLRTELRAFVQAKGIAEPAPTPTNAPAKN